MPNPSFWCTQYLLLEHGKKKAEHAGVKLKGKKTAQDPTSASECVGFALCGGKAGIKGDMEHVRPP